MSQAESQLTPEDWSNTNIGDFAPLQRGFDLPNRDRIDGNYPVVYSNGVMNFHNTYQVKGPGVITGRSGTIGKVHYVNEDYWPHNTALWVKKFNNAIPKYVYYLYTYIGFDRFSSGSGVPTLNRNDAHSFAITVPTKKEEQTAIANALSDVDALLTELEKLIAKKQAIKTATMQQLLTGKTRLPQFATYTEGAVEGKSQGQPKGTKPCELGEIPEDWDVSTLGGAATFINGRAYALHEWETSGTPVIRLQNLTGRGADYYYSNLKLPEKQYCDNGDLLFMWSATFGPVIWKGDKAIYHYHIWKIENKEISDSKFLYFVLLDMTEKLKNSSSSGGTMLHITKGMMESTPCILPSKEEQTAIATILTDMDNEIQTLEQRLAKTRHIKQGMMQQLLTGRTRLPY